jgi:hypothetical protein
MSVTREAIEDINKVLPKSLQLTDKSAGANLWAALFRLYGDQVQGPKGFATWKDVAIDALIKAHSPALTIMREALERIENPVNWEVEHVEAGYKIDGAMVIAMTEKAPYYQRVAREALEAVAAATAPAA